MFKTRYTCKVSNHLKFAKMAFAIFAFLFVSPLSQTTAVWLQSALDRHQNNMVSYGNFIPDLHYRLEVPKITSSLVGDQFDCPFNCIGEPKCYSFNQAAYPDSNGLFLCELLATNKYNATASQLQENASFHHYGPWVSRLEHFICFALKFSQIAVELYGRLGTLILLQKKLKDNP